MDKLWASSDSEVTSLSPQIYTSKSQSPNPVLSLLRTVSTEAMRYTCRDEPGSVTGSLTVRQRSASPSNTILLSCCGGIQQPCDKSHVCEGYEVQICWSWFRAVFIQLYGHCEGCRTWRRWTVLHYIEKMKRRTVSSPEMAWLTNLVLQMQDNISVRLRPQQMKLIAISVKIIVNMIFFT